MILKICPKPPCILLFILVDSLSKIDKNVEKFQNELIYKKLEGKEIHYQIISKNYPLGFGLIYKNSLSDSFPQFGLKIF